MKEQLLFLFFIFLNATSCISVKLTPETQKAKAPLSIRPTEVFEEISLQQADRAWKSIKTGNTISYYSECTGSLVSLNRLRDEFLLSLNSSKIIESSPTEHDGREALRSIIEGRVEGIPIRLDLLIYQKNGCRYSISYAARAAEFEKEMNDFNQFIQGFHLP